MRDLPVPVPTVRHDMDVFALTDLFVKSGWAGKGTTHAQVTVKLLWGAEMGLGPVAAVQGIDVIQGQPSPSGGLIAAQIDAHPRYAYTEVVRNKSLCRLAFFVGERMAYGSPYADDRLDRWHSQHPDLVCPPGFGLRPGVTMRGVEEYTIADAEDAKLTGKDNWRKYARAMLFNRAITEGQRAYAPNLWGGLKNYTPDELGSEAAPAPVEGETVEAEVVASRADPPAARPTPEPVSEGLF